MFSLKNQALNPEPKSIKNLKKKLICAETIRQDMP